MRLPWNRKESDLEREVRYHLEALADSFERQGFSPAEAMLRARREFGGVEQYKEQCRDERRWQPLAQLMQDLTFGVRMMRKAPAVTSAAVLSLALGIGATTAILTLMDAVLWRSLAVPQPEQVTEVLWQSKERPEAVYHSSSGSMFLDGATHVADFFSRSAFETLRASIQRADVAAHLNPDDVSTSYGGVTAVAELRPVSGNFFPMLQVRPMAGRLLTPSDDQASAPLTVVVSHSFWATNLASDWKAVGRVLRVNNRSYTIAGVLPEQFSGITTGDSTDLYTTFAHAPSMLDSDSWERRAGADPMSWYIQLLARRAPGVTMEALAPEMDALFHSTWAGQPKNQEGSPSVRLRSASGGIGSLRRDVGNPLRMLLVLVGFVLLIACVNITNLMLARADTRRREVALRVSLGCSRSRLIRQFFTESVLLAACGGVLSVGVMYATAHFAVTLMPGEPRLNLQVDFRVILATLAVTALTTLAFGLYPAWRAAQMDAAPALKEGGVGPGGVRHTWIAPGKIMVLAQVAFSVLLVAAGAAFTTHLRKIVTKDTGFERTRLLMFDLRPGQSGYRDERLRQFYFQLEQRLRQVPGVEAAGLARIRPMRGGGYFDDIRVAGDSKGHSTAVNFVTAGYLEALGVAVVAGRPLTRRDILTRAKVAVVSEDLGKEIGRSPLGLRIQMEDKEFEVVGVAARARYARLTEQPNVLYVPNTLDRDTITALVRTSVPPTQAMGGVRNAVEDLDANLPMVQTVTMQEQIALTLRRERLFAWLCGAFGALALVLCMVGLYGVMAYATVRRSQEMGIRVALGASPANLLRQVVGEGVGVALAGCVVGTPIAWWAAQRYVDYKKLGMEPLDPSILAWTSGALALSALLAVLGPATRAASSDPIKALREG
ncbi:ABC transporter permease [uncultured Paludibaculum sp.]|uniref:ABC transporter permease n=1 Tax=uncultured Paludibaculum sp. TaxID=1765020 RepID=UPI002AAAE32C|nr:ABC transporter permease [uncultured Paludibaculum sp.]